MKNLKKRIYQESYDPTTEEDAIIGEYVHHDVSNMIRILRGL